MSNNNIKQKKKSFKVLLIGDTAVGKTSIILQYTKHIHPRSYISTIGLDFAIHDQKLNNGKNVELRIYDTAGQEKFSSIVKNLYNTAQGLILVYDITSIKSFHNINNWLNYVKENSKQNVKLILVGNKTDLEEKREVSYDEGSIYASKHGMLFYECSANTGQNIDKIFIESTREIDKRIKDGFYDLSNENCIIKQGTMTSSITLNNNKNKEESGYCCT